MSGKTIQPSSERPEPQGDSLAQEQADAFDDDRRRGFVPGTARLGVLVPLFRN